MRSPSLLAIVFLAIGCASGPPAELVSARQTYERARVGSAAQLAPEELSRSRALLSQAEEKYQESPGSRRVRDLAYAAEKQARRAEILAGAELAKQDKASAEADLLAAQAEVATRAEHRVARSEERALTASQRAEAERQARVTAEQRASSEAAEAAAEKARAESEETARTQAERQLAAQTDARLAERKARAAMDALTRAALVREESRGTVISLESEALFGPDGVTLMPSVMARLDAVADTIKGRPEHLVVIECSGDSDGPEAYRHWLANKRGAALRDYLLAKGVPSEQVRAVGLSSLPASSRVEIIIQR